MAGDKLDKTEVDERITTCFELRFKTDPPMLQREWIKYCHKHYRDKSEQQYHWYWAQAKEKYDEQWRAKLNQMLDPAMNELFGLLGSDDEKIRQRAIDQIVKYTGNDIQKIEAKIQGDIRLSWGNDPGDEQE
jgi:hypothetical protein